ASQPEHPHQRIQRHPQVAHVPFRPVHGIINAAIGLVNQQQVTAAATNLPLLMAELATDIEAIRGLASARS
ncbi:MAG: hypothetical protein NTZ54_05770, partial [Alphaproteobacteria bacterium]|nr:hypothetical protein [Alphaproteobacteria bacterium]